MSSVKQENFRRIAENRVTKIVDLIAKLQNLSNTSFYEYTDTEIDKLFDIIQSELDKQRKEFKKKGRSKKVEL